MWWWNSRGYTPAGVEAWNCVRAIDYLQTRKEVDPERIGATGRSGGGAYSWFVAAIDDRIKAVVPVAGITDLENHVVDGVVEGHCDCMYFVNTYRWDYPQLAAMIAPRPLLISNTDKDKIFPLDGVLRTHEKVRKIYKLYGAENNLGVHITEGPHADTQELYTHAFVWLDRFLMGERRPIDGPAEKRFEPEQLKVFDKLPDDQINTKIHETFVPQAPPPQVPKNKDEWATMKEAWMKDLREKVFRGWPDSPGDLNVSRVFEVERDGVRFAAYDFDSQRHVRLRLFLLESTANNKPARALVQVLNEEAWQWFLSMVRPAFADQLTGIDLPKPDPDRWNSFRETLGRVGPHFWFAPRGIGYSAWDASPKKQLHNRRRFMLLGQTLAGMQVWDTRRAIQAARTLDAAKNTKVRLHGIGQEVGVVTLFASLFEPEFETVWVTIPSTSREAEPDLLNVHRFVDLRAAAAMAADRAKLAIYITERSDWDYLERVSKSIGWDEARAVIRPFPPKNINTDEARGP
jgi:hypothetical protein